MARRINELRPKYFYAFALPYHGKLHNTVSQGLARKRGPQYSPPLKICARYDNVWSYTNKVIEVCRVIAK